MRGRWYILVLFVVHKITDRQRHTEMVLVAHVTVTAPNVDS